MRHAVGVDVSQLERDRDKHMARCQDCGEWFRQLAWDGDRRRCLCERCARKPPKGG